MSNSKPVNILLIEDDPEFAELVQDWLSGGEGGGFSLNWTDCLADGLKRLEQGNIDIVLLDLGLPDSNGADTFAKVRAGGARIPTIILSVGNSEALALDMIREGAEDYLLKSSCTQEALIRSVRYAMIRHRSGVERQAAVSPIGQAKLVGVIGAKGGVGTTTVSWCLAAEFGRQTGQKVLICDLDLDRGMVAFLAGLELPHSLKDATENIPRLDLSFWQWMVGRGLDGLEVLASPRFQGLGELDIDNVSEVISRVRGFYDWIVLDFGSQNTSLRKLAETANELLLVTTTSLSSLYQAKSRLDGIPRTIVEGARVRVIVNEIERSAQLSRTDLASAFGFPICGILPGDGAELNQATLDRRLPSESSNFRKEIAKLARNVAGLPDLKPKRGIVPFFSRRGPEEGSRT